MAVTLDNEARAPATLSKIESASQSVQFHIVLGTKNPWLYVTLVLFLYPSYFLILASTSHAAPV